MSVPATAFAQGRKKVRGTAGLPVSPIGPVYDVTTLPVSSRQYPDWASYRTLIGGLAYGASYLDSVSGARVYRLGVGRGEYSAGGPFTPPRRVDGSLWVVWEGKSPQVSKLTRLTPGNPTATTVNLGVQPVNPGLLQVAFSRVTPWLLYVIKNGSTLTAVDIRSNTEVSQPGLPIDLSSIASGSWQWLTVSDNDALTVFSPNTPSPTHVVHIGPPPTRTILTRTASSLTADSGGALTAIDEGNISPSGRFVQINNGSAQMVVWDTVTNCVSGNWSGSGLGQWAHTDWAVGDVLVAPFTGESDARLMRCVVPPITANGQAQPTEVFFSGGSTRATGNHVGGDRATPSTQRWVGGQAANPFLGAWDEADWTNEGGGRWSRLVTSNNVLWAAQGVTSVARVDGTGTYVATLTRRGDTALAVDEWHYVSGTGRLWVRLASGANPGTAIRPHMESKANGAFGLAFIPFDDASSPRVIALHHSVQANYNEQAQPHVAATRECVIYTTDHGVPGGPGECMVAVFPTS